MVVERKRRRVRLATAATIVALGLSFEVFSADREDKHRPDKKSGLGQRLIRETSGATDEDLMATVLRLMHDSAERLEIEFDPGDETQIIQREILHHLDDAIKAAALQRRFQPPSQRSRSADRRRMPKQGSAAARPPEGAARAKGTSAEASAKGDPAAAPRGTGSIRETRRAWGHLPQRDREEIIQGVEDEFLEAYRIWIEQYYRALQEVE